MRTRLWRLVICWPLVALGIAMLLRAHLGVAPFDVLSTGTTKALGWPFSVVYLAVSLVFYAVGAALGGRLGWASVVGTFVISPLISVFHALVPESPALAVRIPLMAGATVILAVAVCLVITTELGAGPTEVFMLGLIRRGTPLVVARWVSDGLPLVVGALLGGAVGVGTIIFGFALGPLIKLGFRLLHYVPPRRADLDLVIAVQAPPV